MTWGSSFTAPRRLLGAVPRTACFRDRSRFSKISIMSHATDWSVSNRLVMTYFLQEMQALQDEGVIEWAREKQVVDAYLGR